MTLLLFPVYCYLVVHLPIPREALALSIWPGYPCIAGAYWVWYDHWRKKHGY